MTRAAGSNLIDGGPAAARVCLRPLSKRDPAVAKIVTAWRRLTTPAGKGARIGSGAKTLVACSGGADSSALVLSLAAAGAPVVVAHVVHDQRAAGEALADRDAVRRLAEALGLEFAEATVEARGRKGNGEAVMRRLRYAALARLAEEHEAGFVATGHHAHDQVETVLMALVRGAGPTGLRGIAARRPLDASPVVVLRPMLAVEPAEARRLCAAAGWVWREDATNADISRLRNRLRAKVLPELLAVRPGAAGRIVDAAALQGQIAGGIGREIAPAWRTRETGRDAEGVVASVAWRLALVSGLGEAAIGELMRRGFRYLGGRRDRLSARQVREVVRAVRSGDRGRQVSFDWTGVRVSLFGNALEMRRVERAQA